MGLNNYLDRGLRMTISRFTLVCSFLLNYTPSAFSMMNHSYMTDLKWLRTMYETIESNNAILEKYPNELMFAIMRHLSLSDCAALTATCKTLHDRPWFPGTTAINPDHIRKDSEFRTCMQQAGYTSIMLAGAYGPFIIPAFTYFVPNNYEYSGEIKSAALLTGFLGSFCFFMSGVIFGWTNKIKDTNKVKIHNTTIPKTNAYLTNGYHTLAKKMCEKQIIPDTLKIHYHNNEQVKPLLEAAKKCDITDLTIYFCKGDHYDVPCCGDIAIENRQEDEKLDLYHLLDDNAKLKKLTIKGDPYFKDNIPLLFPRFHKGLQKKSLLTSLTLDSCSDVAARNIISIINTTKNIRELTIAHSSPYSLPQNTNQKINSLLHNTKLIKLTLIDCAFDDDSAIALQNFMQSNTNLQLLHIKQLGSLYCDYELSNQGKALLQNSPHKPKELIIE
jgi:hypothetical protein